MTLSFKDYEFQFIPFWKITDWGCHLSFMFGPILWPNKGCDEHHNKSRSVLIPLVGEFIFFKLKYDRSELEHVYGYNGSTKEISGAIVPDCDICQEVVEDFFNA